MPIRRSPNGADHIRPQAGRDQSKCLVAINRNHPVASGQLLGFQLLSRFQLIVGFYEEQPGSVPIAHSVSFPQALFRTATEQLNIRHSVLPPTDAEGGW